MIFFLQCAVPKEIFPDFPDFLSKFPYFSMTFPGKTKVPHFFLTFLTWQKHWCGTATLDPMLQVVQGNIDFFYSIVINRKRCAYLKGCYKASSKSRKVNLLVKLRHPHTCKTLLNVTIIFNKSPKVCSPHLIS